jgi:hypothetical protein
MTVATGVSTPALPARPVTTGQVTQVEQSRAIAEVQAAVFVAQQAPRDMDRAVYDMRETCGRMALAERAFYSVPNRGNGPSVHLARELARVFGNVQYGVHELRRDDEEGESEIQAFAWDVEKNVRSTRTFIVPHARMVTDKQTRKQTRQPLIDLGDVYNNNQNVGARAVREVIFSVLPDWFVQEAQQVCRQTLQHGDGVPLIDRITNMVAAFKAIGVSEKQIEAKLERGRGRWSAADAARLQIDYRSITQDSVPKDELFPPEPVSVASVRSRGGQPANPALAAKVVALPVEEPPADPLES